MSAEARILLKERLSGSRAKEMRNMNNTKIQINVKGTTPMIMHSSRTANPLDPFAKALKKVSSKRAKTDEDYEQLAKIEYEASLYRDADDFKNGPNLYMPTENIIACLVNAGKKLKNGRSSMKAAITGIIPSSPLGYELKTPWDSYEEMCGDERSWFQKIVNVQGSKVVRTRVLIPEWSFTMDAELETNICDVDMLGEILTVAGRLIGLGDWRPSSGTPGSYGKFLAKVKAV